jgi:hypothetical protein
MAKFNVCIKTVVNVIVDGVEAESQEEALKKAEEGIDFETLFNESGRYAGADRIGWGEENTYAVVDQLPDNYDHIFKCQKDGTWVKEH